MPKSESEYGISNNPIVKSHLIGRNFIHIGSQVRRTG